MHLVGEAKSAMQDAQDMDVNPPDNNLTLEEREEMLNAGLQDPRISQRTAHN